MDKIGELKEKLAKELYDHQETKLAFTTGFSAAMELQLPVKFLEYVIKDGWDYLPEYDIWERKGSLNTWIRKRSDELYKEFQNIYQPE